MAEYATRACEVCGNGYKPTYHKQRTCGRKCGVELRRRIGSLPELLHGQTSRVPWIACRGCQEPFLTRNAQRYCAACLESSNPYYWLNRRNEQLKDAEPRPCKVCGNEFVPDRATAQGNYHTTVYCSTECRSIGQRQKAHNYQHKRRTNGAYEHITLDEIAKRDSWRCHICKRTVTRDTWSLDHLVPVSRGGDHTRTNVALAHRSCNSRMGVARLPAQLLLVG